MRYIRVLEQSIQSRSAGPAYQSRERDHKSQFAAIAAVTIAAAAGLIFDAVTPSVIEVTIFYVGVVLVGYWLPHKKASLALILLVAPLVIVGRWVSIPEAVPEWQIWFNRGLAVVTLSLTACFVWYVRVLEADLGERNAEVTRWSQERDQTNQRLRKANEEFTAMCEHGGILIGRFDSRGVLVDASRAGVEDLGFVRGDLIGRRFWEAAWWRASPMVVEWIRERVERALAGEPSRGETSYFAANGKERVTDIAMTPIKDDSGRVELVVVGALDITERAQQYMATFENAAAGIAHFGPDLKWSRVNGALCCLIGYPEDELVNRPVTDILHPDYPREIALADIDRIRSGVSKTYDAERRYRRKDGATVWLRVCVSAIRAGDGEVQVFVGVFHDVTDRKRAEEQVQLRLREMNHRGKNILSLVQVVARQTASSDPEHFIECFTDRIRALTANQDLLARTRREGVDAEDLVRGQLAHFGSLLDHRIRLKGPKLRLNGTAAQAVGMALHELATNATKYGALSTDAGSVDVEWEADPDLFRMNWIERGGPPVRAPDKRGFGSTVIEQMTRHALDGEGRLDFDPGGVAWHVTCPAAKALELR